MVAVVELQVHLLAREEEFPRRGGVGGVTADKATEEGEEEKRKSSKSREGSARYFARGKLNANEREDGFSAGFWRKRRAFREDGFDGFASKRYPSNHSIIRGYERTLTEIACTRIDREEEGEIIERRNVSILAFFNLCFVLFCCWVKKRRKKKLTFIEAE